MSEAHWKTCDDTILGLEADFQPECVFCGAKMEDFTSRILDFPLDLKNVDNVDGHAVDITIVCSGCGWTEVFGVAIDKEHHRRLRVVKEDLIRNASDNIKSKH